MAIIYEIWQLKERTRLDSLTYLIKPEWFLSTWFSTEEIKEIISLENILHWLCFGNNNDRKLWLCGKDSLIWSSEWMKNGLKLLVVNILLIFTD